MTVQELDRFDWSTVLRPDRWRPRPPGATAEEIELGSRITFEPIAAPEVRRVRDFIPNPWLPGTPEYDAWVPTDASKWVFPSGPFPPSYLSLVRWANGGRYQAGVDRELAIIPIHGVRTKMIELQSPKNMPLAVPFAWDDVYHIYCFDMRVPLRDEYPILVTRGNVMDYAYSSFAASGLLEFLMLPDKPEPPSRLVSSD